MSIFNIDPVQIENSSASLEGDDSIIRLVLKGDIDMRDTSIEFLPYLIRVHEALLQNNAKNIFLDMLNLTFMNSNGIRSLINWIMKLNELPEDKKYTVHIIANNSIAWQESTLPVLKKLFPDSIVIDQV